MFVRQEGERPVNGDQAHGKDDAGLQDARPDGVGQDEPADEQQESGEHGVPEPVDEPVTEPAPEQKPPEERAGGDEPFVDDPRKAEKAQRGEDGIKKARQDAAEEPRHHHPGVDEPRTAGDHFRRHVPGGAGPEDVQRLHGKSAAPPGDGRKQMRGLHVLDEVMVPKAVALAAQPEGFDVLVQHGSQPRLAARGIRMEHCRGNAPATAFCRGAPRSGTFLQ